MSCFGYFPPTPPGVVLNSWTGCGWWPTPDWAPPNGGGSPPNGKPPVLTPQTDTSIHATPSGGTNIPATPSGGTNIPAEPVLPDPAVPTEPQGPGQLAPNPITVGRSRVSDIQLSQPSTVQMDGRKYRVRRGGVLERVKSRWEHPVPGDAGDIALHQGQFDAKHGLYRPELFSAGFQQKIYEQGHNEKIQNPGPVKWAYKTAQDHGYPWEDPTLHVKNYPMPASFYDVGNPQGAHVFSDPELLIRALLGSILVMADMDTSLAVAPTGAPLRQEVSDLLAASEYNDGLYGTTTTALAGGRRRLGAKSRGINWEAHHAPVRKLLAEGKQPYRTTLLNGNRLEEHLEASDAPLVWIPGVNLDILRKHRRLSTEGMKWSDGRSMLEPPPAVARLGLDTSGVRFPGGRGYAQPSRSGTARDWWQR